SFGHLAAGNLSHTCAVTTGNRAYCWGYNFVGALGDGSNTDRSLPTAVLGGLQFRAVSPGSYHTCGIAMDNRVYCWGHNAYGQLGNGSNAGPQICAPYFLPCSTIPVAVKG